MIFFSRISSILVLGLCALFMKSSASKMSSPIHSLNLSEIRLLSQAHAHNDYEHANPLQDALAHGFSSIEADVYLKKGELYVSHHSPIFPDSNRTLSKLYLDPLYQIYLNHGAAFFSDPKQSINLMIDIKSEKNKTYEKLKELLTPYQQMCSFWEHDLKTPNAINIILSGNRPIEKVLQETKRYVQIDGRIEDIGKNYSSEFMPIISDNYSKICSWQFFSRTPNKQNLEKIRRVADAVHSEGKRLRLWNTSENEATWKAIMDQGVDIINSDKLVQLSEFLRGGRDQVLL